MAGAFGRSPQGSLRRVPHTKYPTVSEGFNQAFGPEQRRQCELEGGCGEDRRRVIGEDGPLFFGHRIRLTGRVVLDVTGTDHGLEPLPDVAFLQIQVPGDRFAGGRTLLGNTLNRPRRSPM